MQHRVGCGCGWFYETADKYLGKLECRRMYAEHVEKMHPLRVITSPRPDAPSQPQ